MTEAFLETFAKLKFGNFFSPWTDVWDVEGVNKSKCQGSFDKISRTKGYYKNVVQYKATVEGSEQANRPVDEGPVPLRQAKEFHPVPQVATGRMRTPKQRKGKKKKKSSSRSQSGDSSPGSNDLVLPLAHPSSSAESLSSYSMASASYHSPSPSCRSQTMDLVDFTGQTPSARARMIPNPGSTDCYKYYTTITQAVLGLKGFDAERLKRIARLLANSDYNLLRAPAFHGNYLDIKPCWILTPGCTLEEMKAWKPGDQSYPVLAMARGCGDTKHEEAYRAMCVHYYNEDTFDTSNKIKGTLKTSKCTSDVFKNATENLRTMVLAMTETLFGRGFYGINPDIGLANTGSLSEKDRKYVENKLKGKLKPKSERSSEEHRQIPVSSYNVVQFEWTKASMFKDGIKLPKERDNLVLDKVELLQFEVDPLELDVYPDPFLLLIKAAINWSWCCDQKLLPACGRPDAPSSPVPTMIEITTVPLPVPVTPDKEDD